MNDLSNTLPSNVRLSRAEETYLRKLDHVGNEDELRDLRDAFLIAQTKEVRPDLESEDARDAYQRACVVIDEARATGAKTLVLDNGAGFEQLTHLPPSVGTLHELTRISIDCSCISDLTPIEPLKMLTSISAWETNISSLEPLSELENLTDLSLGLSPIKDLSPLVDLNTLETLALVGTNITSLSPLAGAESLSFLSVWDTGISTLEPLRRNQALRGLNIKGTPISDLSPIADLALLVSLWTTIKDTSALDHLTELEISSD